MSGGHWNYQSYDLEETGQKAADAFSLLSQFEHELDWGISGDTCLECAKRRVGAALIRFFDGDTDAALAVARDRQQNRCCRCADSHAELLVVLGAALVATRKLLGGLYLHAPSTYGGELRDQVQAQVIRAIDRMEKET